MKLIPLTRGKSAMVDDEDFEWLNSFRWHACHQKGTWYAVRNITVPNSAWGQAKLRMHQALIPCSKMVDHRDRNGLNNQKYNLRAASDGENQRNKIKIKRRASSRFKGVNWNKRDRLWFVRAQSLSGRRVSLGCYHDEVEAAKAYDDYARDNFGEFARLNFPDSSEAGAIEPTIAG